MGDEDGVVGVVHLSLALKTLLTFLSILAIVVPAVLGFVNLDRRQDILEGYKKTHDKRFECLEREDKEINKEVVALKLATERIQIQYAEILRRLDRIDLKFDRWEPDYKEEK